MDHSASRVRFADWIKLMMLTSPANRPSGRKVVCAFRHHCPSGMAGPQTKRACGNDSSRPSQHKITIPDELDKELATFADREGITKAEAFRRALNLVKVANNAHGVGRSVGLVKDDGDKLTAIGLITGI
jgi:hypothetical protein